MKKRGSKAPLVLVGMSHPLRRSLLARNLRADGCRVRVAANGYQLVRHMSLALDNEGGADPKPDLILVDATMPGCMGLTILEGIRQLAWDTPVLVIVDFNDRPTAERAFALGADRVFIKPIHVPDVVAAVTTLLMARGAWRPDTIPAPRGSWGRPPALP